MIKNHPFQFVYFNKFAGKNVASNFELDYWGTSNKSVLKYIINNDSKKYKMLGRDSMLTYNSKLGIYRDYKIY